MRVHLQTTRNKINQLALLALKEKDDVAFSSLYAKFILRFKNFAMFKYGLSECDAEDAVHDTFIKMLENPSFDPNKGSFTTWAHRILINVMIDTRRKKKKHGTLLEMDAPKEYWYGAIESEMRRMNRQSYPSDRKAERSSEIAVLHTAIERLPDKYRILIILRDIQELTYKEIYQITGLKEGTMKARLFRAREQLKKLLCSINVSVMR